MKPRRRPGRILTSLALLAAAACFPFDAGEHRLDDQYFLRATDVAQQMALYRQVSETGGIERIGRTVFAAGADPHHVIVQRHPAGDRRRTEYFIVERARDSPLAEPSASVRGPFTRNEFERARVQLGVAPTLRFSLVLEDLR